MRWYRNLYLGPNAAPHIQKIRKKVAEGAAMAGVYYVTRSSARGGLLDIFHSVMLKETLFRANQCTDVVGVAYGKMEAFRLVQDIVKEVYEATGSVDLGSYFKAEDFSEDQEI